MSIQPENLFSRMPTAEYSGPRIPISIGGSALELTRQNTVLKSYSIGEGMFDHMEHQLEDGRAIALTMDMPGTDSLQTDLIDQGFVHIKSDDVDQGTWNWYFDTMLSEIIEYLEQQPL